MNLRCVCILICSLAAQTNCREIKYLSSQHREYIMQVILAGHVGSSVAKPFTCNLHKLLRLVFSIFSSPWQWVLNKCWHSFQDQTVIPTAAVQSLYICPRDSLCGDYVLIAEVTHFGCKTLLMCPTKGSSTLQNQFTFHLLNCHISKHLTSDSPNIWP